MPDLPGLPGLVSLRDLDWLDLLARRFLECDLAGTLSGTQVVSLPRAGLDGGEPGEGGGRARSDLRNAVLRSMPVPDAGQLPAKVAAAEGPELEPLPTEAWPVEG